MRRLLLFDVDGTLTRPREEITPELAGALGALAGKQSVAFVTGSDIGKLARQVPSSLLAEAFGAFTCSGAEFWQRSRLVFAMRHDFPEELIEFIGELIEKSPYPIRAGRHIEHRTGSLNVSVVGRNADSRQRQEYCRHDSVHGERARLVRMIMDNFPDYEANCGGQISIDISPRGWNKGRVLKEIETRFGPAEIHFFGDRVLPGGNDEPLARLLREAQGRHVVHAVSGPRETLDILAGSYLEAGTRSGGSGSDRFVSTNASQPSTQWV